MAPERAADSQETCMSVHIHLANPRGFCAGVDRAIGIVDRALELFGAPIYVRHEVVHNRFVVDDLRRAARCSSMNSTRCPKTPP
jgi:4-hydroxy-3-methylbut-2-enyl diphosphate reductase IspH